MYLQQTEKQECWRLVNLIHPGPERVVFPQGKLGGCTVISRDVTLNYTTYYLNLRNTGGNCRSVALLGEPAPMLNVILQYIVR